MRALVAVFRAGARDALRSPGDLAGQTAFLCLLLFVFSRLWAAVGEAADGWTVGQLVAYLLVTELVALSSQNVHLEIAQEVRSGDVAVQLLRPVPYVQWQLARAAGSSLARCAWLFASAGPVAWLLGGMPRLDPRGLAFGLLVLVPAAVVVEACARVALGLVAFWIEDAMPAYWVWQKATFLLGGLVVPMAFYPDWLRALAAWTPFPALLSAPATAVVRFEWHAAVRAALVLGAWAAAFLVLVHAVHARACRAVQAQGG